jgi:LPXTG-motif cell wall-anchored protein
MTRYRAALIEMDASGIGLTAVAAAGAVTAAAVVFAAPGSAAPYVQAPALSVSTSRPCQSTSLAVAGTAFVPGSTETLTLRPAATALGSAVAGAAGGFTATVTVPEVTGTRQLVAAGPPAPGNANAAQATLHIQGCAGPVPVTGYSGGPAGGTGYARPAGLAGLACLILGGGLLAWRRRKHAA